MYAEGHGRMLVKVASLWPVADASGAQTDQAIYKLPGGDLEYIDVTLTGLHCDTGAAEPEPGTR